MTSHTALSVSIGVLGGIAAALCLGPLSGIVLIWAVFIAWACFFATGGDGSALQNTIVCSVLGAIIAWDCITDHPWNSFSRCFDLTYMGWHCYRGHRFNNVLVSANRHVFYASSKCFRLCKCR